MTPPIQAPDFRLKDQHGTVVSTSALRGKVVALTSLYTHCPDACPLIADMVHKAYQRLGKGPFNPDGSVPKGKVGRDVATADAYRHARSVGLVLLSVMKETLGSLDHVRRVVKVLGMVNSAPEFSEQPQVINGCSDLFVEVFGEKGRHARSAVGMGALPGGITVEIEVIVEVD